MNHVSHAALPYPVWGARFTVPIPYIDATGAPSDPVTPDTEISKDGGAYVDCVEEETTIAGANGSAFLTLTGDETSASLIFLAAKSVTGPKNTLLALQPQIRPVLRTATAAGGSLSTITFDTGAVAMEQYYLGCLVKTTGGTGGGGGSGARDNQARLITAYAGTTRVASVSPDWEVAPDATTSYEVLQNELAGHTLAAPIHPTMLPSQVDVANLALLKLGSNTILTFDDDSVHAKAAKLLYPRIVDTVLRAHRWRFSIRQATLPALAGSPTWRYTYRYALPADPFCLKVVRTSTDDDRGDSWEIQGREIYTNRATLTIEYVARITDPQQWDALFLEALTERLAAELAIPITNTVSFRDGLLKSYLLKVQEARTHDGFEATPEEMLSTELTDVR